MRYLSAFLLALLLLSGCSGEEDLAGGVAVGGVAVGSDGDDGQAVLTVQVADGGRWTDADATFTRAFETLEGLRQVVNINAPADGEGFGIYCSRMGLSNQQVVWNANASRWYYGDDIYWPRSQGRKYVSFNNSKTMQSEGSYFTISSNATIDTKFNSCVYRGVTYGSGLRMVEGTAISFTSGNLCNVIIVQSNWSAFTLKFDEVEIPMSTASGKITISANTYDYTLTTIPGGRVYTIYEVAAGSHTIQRGSGESGVLYVSVERCFTVHAYAPYKGTSPYTFDEANHLLSFATDGGKAPVDLLYASDATVSQSSGETILDFKHALARVAFGTIGNTKGARDMLVTNIGVKGTYYTSGKLNLSSGEWSDLASGSETTVNVVDEAKDEFVFVASGDQKMVRTTQVQADYSVKVKDVEKPMFIPGPTAEVTFKYYEQPDLVALDDDFFHVWDGRGAGAATTATPLTDPTYEYYNHLGDELSGANGGGTVIGSSQVHHLAYANLTDYDKLLIVGTPGLGLRILMNRLAYGESGGDHYNGGQDDTNGGKLVDKWVNIGVDGYVVLDLTWLKTLDSFVHLNAIKVHYGHKGVGTVSRLLLLRHNHEAKTASHSTTLQQGKSAVFNLAVGRNFEVEIDGGASRLMNNE